MRHCLSLLLIALLLPCSAAQSTEQPNATSDPVTFVVLRHAEKSTDDRRDPSLTEAGQQRAAEIASTLSTRGVTGVYSSDYRRTRDTAAPTATQAGLETTVYNAGDSADAFAERLRSTHQSGVVLIVGHSNTVPALVAALCQCAVDEIDESDYGNWFEITIEGNERKLFARRY